MKSAATTTGIVRDRPISSTWQWQLYVNSRSSACGEAPRYCGWAISATSIVGTSTGSGCKLQDCPDIFACQNKCNTMDDCIGFHYATADNGGYLCHMKSAATITGIVRDKPFSPAWPNAWRLYVNSRSSACGQAFVSKSTKEQSYILHLVDDWDKCSADALGGTRQNRDNVGAQYTLGDHVSKWGCSCVGTNPTLWFDTKTEIMYV